MESGHALADPAHSPDGPLGAERVALAPAHALGAWLTGAAGLNAGVAASIGNRAFTRLLQRSEGDPSGSAPPGGGKPADADVRVLQTYQMQEPDLGNRTADPELARRALEWRIKNTALDPQSFRLNVAVIKYERRGRIYYKVMANDPGELHSETLAVGAIAKKDPQWRNTQILEVFTERHPCSNCGPDLKAVRNTIKAMRAARGQPIADFPVFYSVPKWERGATRALDLLEKYLGRVNVPVKPAASPPKPQSNSKPNADPAPETTPKPAVQIRKRPPVPTAPAAADAPPAMSKAAPPAEAPPVVVKPAPLAEPPPVVVKPAPLAEPPPVVVKPAPLAEPPPVVVKPAPLAEPPPVVVKPVTTPEVAAPKINFRAGVKSFGASVLMLLGGWWFSKTFTEPAIESLIKDQVKALEPDIAKRTRKEVENVLATGWATREPRPEYYLYVTLDVWRIGVFEAEMANYDFGTPVVGIREVFVSPLYQEEGPWRMNQYPREWEGNFERTMPGVMIEHNFFTSRTPLEKLISTQ